MLSLRLSGDGLVLSLRPMNRHFFSFLFAFVICYYRSLHRRVCRVGGAYYLFHFLLSVLTVFGFGCIYLRVTISGAHSFSKYHSLLM
ncbi:hypothetical protein BJ508DRAFT_21506 [Ascobolus immersus RN42]|uniref:Uncharacterized protein n=1 Tax=Ascobolus immersus RN42 TaxID=1160509 RepID=A0A3N4HNK8_ASCIM|nr:hypothetical protein BJ508DRAFT_21506 [Ascobolus immersus RN42]